MQVRRPSWAAIIEGPRDSETQTLSFSQLQYFSVTGPQIDTRRQERQSSEFPGSQKWFGEHSLPPWYIYRCVVASADFGSIHETFWNSRLIFRGLGTLFIQ